MAADIETAIMGYLADLGTCFTVTPLNLADVLPAIRIARIGGGRSQDDDSPNLDIQTYTTPDSDDPRSSLTLADAICGRILTFPFVADGVVIDYAQCDTAPVLVPYPNQSLSVTRALYRLVLRN